MPKSDQDDKDLVSRILQEARLAVEEVRESSSEECDLWASNCDDERYVVEVKGIHDSLAIAPALLSGKDYSETLAFDSARAVQQAIRDAVGQMKSTAGGDDSTLRVVALLVRSTFDSKVVFQQILGHLYGKRSLLARDGPDHLECLYFSHSAFYRCRDELDAALVVDGDEAMLLLNDYSVRLQRIKHAALSRFFSTHGALYDAEKFRQEGHLVATDCTIDRSHEQAVLQFVANKYGLTNAIVMNFQRHSAFVAASREIRSEQ